MTKDEIRKYLEDYKATKAERTIVLADFGNIEKWKNSLKWKIEIHKLAILIKHFSTGNKFLRRFYYGSDYGPHEKCDVLVPWSKRILEMAQWNNLEVITKRVKYIHKENNAPGYDKKCDLDVEMTVDLIRERENYDTIVIFSGDGDLMCAVKYLKKEYNKKCIVFGARNHVGREVYDAKIDGFVEEIFYAEDFEYRLRMDR